VEVEHRLAVVESEIKRLSRDLNEVKELTMETRDIVMELSGRVKATKHSNGSTNHAVSGLVDLIKFLIAALLGALGFKIAGGGS